MVENYFKQVVSSTESSRCSEIVANGLQTREICDKSVAMMRARGNSCYFVTDRRPGRKPGCRRKQKWVVTKIDSRQHRDACPSVRRRCSEQSDRCTSRRRIPTWGPFVPPTNISFVFPKKKTQVAVSFFSFLASRTHSKTERWYTVRVVNFPEHVHEEH